MCAMKPGMCETWKAAGKVCLLILSLYASIIILTATVVWAVKEVL
jgi:hypothetical protein